MLDRDPELRKEFDTVNESVPEADKVDLGKIRTQCKVSKYAIDRINAEKELEKNPKLQEERKQGLQKAILSVDLIDTILQNEVFKASNRPDIVRKNVEFEAQAKELQKDPAKMEEYTLLSMRFIEETKRPMESLPYLTTENGRKMNS